MKRRKRTARTSAQKTRPRGFDYECLPAVMALSSIEFPSHLSAASVDAVAYGSVWSEVVNQTVPTISLVAQRGDELDQLCLEGQFAPFREVTPPWPISPCPSDKTT